MSFFDKAKDKINDALGGNDDPKDRIDDARDDAKDKVDSQIDQTADEAKERSDDAADRTAGEGAGVLDQAGDAAARGIDSAGDRADSATGGRFSEHIDNVENTAEGWVDRDRSAGTQEDKA